MSTPQTVPCQVRLPSCSDRPERGVSGAKLILRPRPLLPLLAAASHPLLSPLGRLSSTVQDRQDARIWNLRCRQGGCPYWDWKGA